MEAAAKLAQLAARLRGPQQPSGDWLEGVTPDYTLGETFTRGVSRGFSRLGSTVTDVIPAMLGSAVGANEYATGQMEEAAAKEEALQRSNPAMYNSRKDVDGARSGIGYLTETMGEQIANLLPSLIPAVGAGGVASRMAIAAAEKKIAAEVVKRGLSEAAAKTFAAKATAQYVAKAGAKAATTGQMAGAGVGSYALNAPEIFQNIYQETGEFAPAAAATFGIASAALDSILPAALASKITGPVKTGIIEKLLTRAGMKRPLVNSIVANVTKGLATEGVTEGMQEGISIAAERFINDNPEVFGAKEWDRIFESMTRGAIAGGGFGVAGGVGDGLSARRERKATEAEAALKAENASALEQEQAQKEQVLVDSNGQFGLEGIEEGDPSFGRREAAFRYGKDTKLKGPDGKQVPLIKAENLASLTPDDKKTMAAIFSNMFGTEMEQDADPSTVSDSYALQRAQQLEKAAASKTWGAGREPLDKFSSVDPARVSQPDRATMDEIKQQAANEARDTGYVVYPKDQANLLANERRAIRAAQKPKSPFELIGGNGQPSAEVKAREKSEIAAANVAARLARVEATKQKKAARRKPVQGELDLSTPPYVAEGVVGSEAAQAGQGDIFGGMPLVPEPKVVTRAQNKARGATAPTPTPAYDSSTATVVPAATDKPAKLALANQLGIGHTWKGFESMAGLDISKPEQAEQVWNTLEGRKVEGANPNTIKKIEAYQARPEFEAARTKAAEEKATPTKKVGAKAAPKPAAKVKKATEETPVVKVKQDVATDTALKAFSKVAQREAPAKETVDVKEPEKSTRKTPDQIEKLTPAKFFEYAAEVDEVTRNTLMKSVSFELESDYAPERKRGRARLDYVIKNQDSTTLEEIVSHSDEVRKLAANVKKNEAFNKGVTEATQKNNEADARSEAKKGPTRYLGTPIYKGENFTPEMREAVKSGNINKLLTLLAETKTGAVAQLVRKLRTLNLRTKIVVSKTRKGSSGQYDPVTNTITLSEANGLNEHTTLHEIVHAAVAQALNNPELPITKAFTKLYESVFPQIDGAYGGQNLQEFAAEFLSNPEFQALLKTLKAPKSESLFKTLVRRVAEFLSFRKGQSAYDAGLKLMSDLIDKSAGVEPTMWDTLYLGKGDFKNTLGPLVENIPTFGDVKEKVLNEVSNIKGRSALKSLFGFLRMDNLNALYGKKLPAIGDIIKAIQRRLGEMERRLSKVNDTYKSLRLVQQKHKAAFETLGKLAEDARIAQVDLLDKTARSPLHTKFRALPESVQDAFSIMRRDYDASLNEYREQLESLEGLSASTRAKIEKEFNNLKGLIGYVPFLRYGDFFVEYTNTKTGEREMQAFESLRERDKFFNSKDSKSEPKLRERIEDVFSGTGAPPSGALGNVLKELQESGASQESQDIVREQWLTMFPAQSIMQQFNKAENIRGASQNLVQGYSTLMTRWTRKLVNSKYTPAVEQGLVRLIESKDDQSINGDNTLMAAVDNIMAQKKFLLNPAFESIPQKLTALSYFLFMSGNISTALINVTSLGFLVYPDLGARFGFDTAAAAMHNAGKLALKDWGKAWGTGKYKGLFEAMEDNAQLRHTQAREVLEGSDGDTRKIFSPVTKTMDFLSKPFQNTETYNRAVTAIAAYDLAIKGNPSSGVAAMSEADAVEYAIEAVKRAHTSGTSATAPRFMQNSFGRVAFTFKSFVWNSAFIVVKAGMDSVKGESPQVKRQARRQLVSMLGLVGAILGAKGLPGYGMASTSYAIANALAGDDDEPETLDDIMRETFGELGLTGLGNRILGIDLSSRAGIANDILWRDDPQSIAEHGYVRTAAMATLGPVGSYALGLEQAFRDFEQGEVSKGLERMMPSFARNVAKSARFMQEGALTSKGDPIKTDFTAWNLFTQTFGFAPADLSSIYARRSAAKSYEKKVMDRRTRLLNRYDLARTHGDRELLKETREEIAKFRKRYPGMIGPDTLTRSYRARRQAEKEMVHGVRFTKGMSEELMEKYFTES